MDLIQGFAGGLMIGLAAAAFLTINGRIMGASGLIGGLVDGSGARDRVERLAFLAGLVAVPALLNAVRDAPLQTGATDSPWLLVAGGLLVGVGTRVGNGCTSGHGVCGISRLSGRGIVATVFYIGAGVATVALLDRLTGILP